MMLPFPPSPNDRSSCCQVPQLLEPLEPRMLLSASYTPYELGTLGGEDSWAYGVNDVSQVVGTAEVGRRDAYGEQITHAFLWTDGEGMVDLGTLGGPSSTAYAVNNYGEVVGVSDINRRDTSGEPVQHAFLWTEATGMVDLGTLGGAASGAVDINDQGEVVGWATIRNGRSRAFLWNQNQGMMSLGVLDGYGDSIARGINEDGQVVGDSHIEYIWDVGYVTHAFVWSPGRGMQDVGDLGGLWSAGTDVNDFGEIVGWAEALEAGDQAVAHAFFSSGIGSITDISPADGVSAAYAINNAAEVLGDLEALDGSTRPFLYETDGSFTWLDTLYGLSEGNDLNEVGQIVGSGVVGADVRALLLDPDRPYVTVDGMRIAEGDAGVWEVEFDIRLSEVLGRSVTMEYTTVDGSAEAGMDYEGLAGTLTFEPGQTRKTVIVEVYGDTAYEGDEAFTLNVFSLYGDVVGDRGTGEIANDDPPPAPDLDAQLGVINLAETLVPGDRGWAQVIVTNVGNGPAWGQADLVLYLSEDFTYDPDTDLVVGARYNTRINLAPGQEGAVIVRASVPVDLAAGEYYLLAAIEPTAGIDDPVLDNNLIGVDQPYELAWQFGDLPGRRNAKLRLRGPDGQWVLFALAGGVGEVVGEDFSEIVVSGTGPGSRMVIRPAGGSAVVGDIVTDGPMAVLAAPQVAVTGDVNIPGGVRVMVLGDLVTGEQTINLGGRGGLARLRLGRVEDLSLTSDDPLASLVVSQWHDTAGEADVITAPWMGALVSGGDAEMSMILHGDPGPRASLGRAVIRGDLTGVTWSMGGSAGAVVVLGAMSDTNMQAAGGLGVLNVGAAVDSDVAVGVGTGFGRDHAESADDFVDALASIRAVVVRGLRGSTGPYLINSNITAGQVGRAVLRGVDTRADDPFGLWVYDHEDRPAVGVVVYTDYRTGERTAWAPRLGVFDPDDELVVELL